jgi:pimeloyl-ACP methyl ester carboxylesterase
MENFKDIPDEAIKGIQAPALVLNNDRDVVRPEHAIELAHTLPHGRLAIFPGVHGECIGEICSSDKNSKIPALVTVLIDDFLTK